MAQYIVGPPADAMAGILHRTIRDDSGFIVAWVNKFAESFGDKADKKNANLLAASGEMLEALKAAYKVLCNGKPSEQVDALHLVSVAIAKAEGSK